MTALQRDKENGPAGLRGVKQTCRNEECGCSFYDLNRTPVVCPYCGTPSSEPVVVRHEFVMGQRLQKHKSYRLVAIPQPVPQEDAEEEENVAEVDDSDAPPDVLIEIDDEDEASTEDIIGHGTSDVEAR